MKQKVALHLVDPDCGNGRLLSPIPGPFACFFFVCKQSLYPDIISIKTFLHTILRSMTSCREIRRGHPLTANTQELFQRARLTFGTRQLRLQKLMSLKKRVSEYERHSTLSIALMKQEACFARALSHAARTRPLKLFPPYSPPQRKPLARTISPSILSQQTHHLS